MGTVVVRLVALAPQPVVQVANNGGDFACAIQAIEELIAQLLPGPLKREAFLLDAFAPVPRDIQRLEEQFAYLLPSLHSVVGRDVGVFDGQGQPLGGVGFALGFVARGAGSTGGCGC